MHQRAHVSASGASTFHDHAFACVANAICQWSPRGVLLPPETMSKSVAPLVPSSRSYCLPLETKESEKLRGRPDLHFDANAQRGLEGPMRIIRIISCPLTLRHSLRPAPVIFDVTWTGSGSATAVVFVSTGLGSMSTVWEEPPTSVEYSLTSESATRGRASQDEASRLCISHHTCCQIVQCCWLARVAALACAKDDGPCAAVLKSRTVRHTRRR